MQPGAQQLRACVKVLRVDALSPERVGYDELHLAGAGHDRNILELKLPRRDLVPMAQTPVDDQV